MSVPGERLRRAINRWKAAFDESLRQQVTASGVLFLGLLTLVGLAAFASANNLLFLLFAALLSTLLISNLVSRLGLAGLELDLDLPDHVAARRKVVGRIILVNNKWTPSFSVHLRGGRTSGLSSELYFPMLPARSRMVEAVEIEFGRRGLYRETDFLFSSRFPFGFTERRAHVTLERDLVVYPSVDARLGFESLLATLVGDLESWRRGRGHDFYRIRPYESMESARHVDWRATAHTGDLQVREFAREEDPALAIFVDLNVPHAREPDFETTVDCAAFLVWHLARNDSRVRLITQNFDHTVPDTIDIYGILRYLALVEPVAGAAISLPDGDSDLFLAFSAEPARLADAGWPEHRVIGMATLSGNGAAERA